MGILVVGAYINIMGVIVAASFVTMLLINPHDCSGCGRAIGGLWAMLVVLFPASVALISVVARKVIPGVVGRLATVTMHGVGMPVTGVVIAFGLMVGFNC